MSDHPYEYKVQHQSSQSQFGGWSDSGLGSWVDEETAVRRFKGYVADEKRMTEEFGVKEFTYRIIRRPKDSETVYLTEGEDV